MAAGRLCAGLLLLLELLLFLGGALANEQELRAKLAADPGSEAAIMPLVGLLHQQTRWEEAEDILEASRFRLKHTTKTLNARALATLQTYTHTKKEEEEESTTKEMTTNVTPPPPPSEEGEGEGEPFRVGTHNTKATTTTKTTKVVTTDERWFDTLEALITRWCDSLQ